MHAVRRARVVAAGTLFWVLATAPGASAHASLLSSTPGSGEEVATAPAAVDLRFSEALDIGAATVVEILSTSGANVGGRVSAIAGQPRSLRVPLRTTARGVYTVTWRVLSSVDGHVTAGAFAFGVGVSPEGAVIPEPRSPQGPTPDAAIGRWLLLFGVAAMIGAGWMMRFAFASVPARLARMAWRGMVLAAAGTVVLADAQRRAAGLSFTEFRTTSLYEGALLRLVPVTLAAALLVVRPQLLWAGASVGGVILAVIHASRGHAGAMSSPVLAIAQQSSHIVAASVWAGGLAALLLVLRHLDPSVRDRAVRTFSRVALWAVVILASSGVVRSLGEVGSLGNLDSRYGAYLMVKVVLLVALIVMGAINRRRNVPRASDRPDGLRAVARAEVAVMVVVLAVTSVLAGTTPPRSDAAEGAPADVSATGSDFATTVRVRFTATPGLPGVNAFAVTLRSFDDDALIDAETVRARFTYAGGGDPVPATTVIMERTGHGAYAATGANLALAGPWEVTLEIVDGTRVRRVDLTVATRRAQEPRATEVAGQPTIYDADLGDLGRVQFYVDPGKVGANEVHATFFDPSGNEPKGYSGFVLTALGPRGTIARLPIRMLTPAHVVASVDLTAGRWRFDAFARSADGQRISGSFNEVIR